LFEISEDGYNSYEKKFNEENLQKLRDENP
jgi:hypothetical protein